MDESRNKNNNDHLSVNRMGRNIRKSSPAHQTNFTEPIRQPRPQVYNINKNDFRNFVQQLTGSPSREPPPRPRQHLNPSPNVRLERIRPPPLTPVIRPQIPLPPPPIAAAAGGNLVPAPADPGLVPTRAESPISAYMRYLQNNFIDSGNRQIEAQPASSTHQPNGAPPGPFLPSPTIFPSPSGFLNLLSPLSPCPLLSPGNHQRHPNFVFSPVGAPRSGIGAPLSPSFGLSSPSSGFFTTLSPRWKNQ